MPNIITPYKETEIVVPGSRLAGHVKIKKIDKHGRETFRTEFKNLITDAFLQNGAVDKAFESSYNQYLWAINAGSGVQTTPQPTDTSLNNFIGYAWLDARFGTTSGTILGPTLDQDYKYIECRATFDYNAAVGDLTEIGLSCAPSGHDASNPTSSSYLLVGKSLIKDSNGNPIVVTKTTDEQLIVSYELRVYRPSETPFPVDIGGTTYYFIYNTMQRSGSAAPFLDDHSDRNSTNEFNNYVGYSPNGSAYTVSKNGLDTKIGGPYYVRVSPSPDTSRSITGFTNYMTSTNAAAPYVTSSVQTLSTSTYYLWRFVCVDPDTGNLNSFNLPSGYRLDYSHTLNRARV